MVLLMLYVAAAAITDVVRTSKEMEQNTPARGTYITSEVGSVWHLRRFHGEETGQGCYASCTGACLHAQKLLGGFPG